MLSEDFPTHSRIRPLPPHLVFVHRDYFMFLYTWRAAPPYDVMHVSHAFIPSDAQDHTGVVFPAGLQLLQSGGLLVSYGKGDDRSMLLTLGRAMLEEMLQPVDGLDARNYELCTISGPDVIDS